MMPIQSQKLQHLVNELIGLRTSPLLIELAAMMKSADLTIADVAPYVMEDPRHYNRSLIALSEYFELLVMTWLPGQSSIPHDHAGSICIMQVLQGEATEGAYSVAEDGYVDFEYETRVPAGELTAGQDAGVHSVRNASDEILVSVHLYTPPLRDFRRFVPRPTATIGAPLSIASAQVPTVVIVGGGFSGSMSAAQMLHQAVGKGLQPRIVVVERRGAVGEGLAYGTRETTHLLNVPAGRMSAWPDRPDDFLQWATSRHPNVRPDGFLPRQWYGEYVRETLLETARELDKEAELSILFDEVRRVARRPEGGWLVHLARGPSVRADAVVIAVGHRPPDDPIGARWTGPRTRLISDPWRPFAMNVIRPEESVMILGSGLTAVDAVMSLGPTRRRASTTILSRRGLLPQAHAPSPLPPVDLQYVVVEWLSSPEGVRSLEVFRGLRRMVRELAHQGSDWRSVVDGLRPHTAILWQNMATHERRRFLRHLRPFWEVHRHRMALAIAEQFGELYDCGQVGVVAGRIVAARTDGNTVEIEFRDRSSKRIERFEADWVVNCTGPAPSNFAAANPAIGSLLVDGWLRADELGLGIDTTSAGNAVDDHGRVLRDLFLVGTLRKPALWESTAVPELRGQAADVAERVLGLLGSL